MWRNNAGIFHPRTPGTLVITVIEKIITVITRLKWDILIFRILQITVSNKMLRNKITNPKVGVLGKEVVQTNRIFDRRINSGYGKG